MLVTIVGCGERNTMYTEVLFLTGFANSFFRGMKLYCNTVYIIANFYLSFIEGETKNIHIFFCNSAT